MICPECSVAGSINHELNTEFLRPTGNHRKALKQRAKRMHKKCSYGVTCPCQHVVGEVLKGATG